MLLQAAGAADTTAGSLSKIVWTYWPIVVGVVGLIAFLFWGWTKATLENRKLALEVEGLRRQQSPIKQPSPAEIEQYGAVKAKVRLVELQIYLLPVLILAAAAIPGFAARKSTAARLRRLEADSVAAVHLRCAVEAAREGTPLDTAAVQCRASRDLTLPRPN